MMNIMRIVNRKRISMYKDIECAALASKISYYTENINQVSPELVILQNNGWSRCPSHDEKSNIVDNVNMNDVSFSCTLFENKKQNQYMLAFRGTNSTYNVVYNWIPGVLLHDKGTRLAKSVVKELLNSGIPKASFIVTGHSLGGRYAQETALCYGLRAICFNSACISVQSHLLENTSQADILHVLYKSDPLTILQDEFKTVLQHEISGDIPFGIVGKRLVLEDNCNNLLDTNFGAIHGMDLIIKNILTILSKLEGK